jgi:carboxyl-terminal processing protease
VKPGSDAEAKGVKAGDRILQIGAFTPSRAELWKVRYLYHVLSPRSVLKVGVQSPGGQPRTIDIAAKVKQEQAVVDVSLDTLIESGPAAMGDPIVRANRNARVGDLVISRLSTFAFPDGNADKMLDETLKGSSSLVLDLRGNGGGLIRTLEAVAGRFFDHDVKIADRVGRKSMKPVVAKKRKTPFTGKLVVLIDADSASASELFARLVQIEKRGVVIGDRSSGSVMQAEQGMGMLEGTEGLIPYAFSITNADLVMADGKSLEHAGVVPDEIVLRTPADLAAGRDPALARAVALLGGTLDPVAAGKMFPVEWK